MNNILYFIVISVIGLWAIYFMLSKIHLLFPEFIKLGFLPDAKARQFYTELKPETHNLVEQIESLGFERLGIRYEQGRLDFQKVYSVCFSSRNAGAFVSIVLSRGKADSFYFLSYFTNGAVILTSNKPGFQQSIDSDDCRYGGLLGGSPAEILDAHKRRVEEFRKRGYPPALDFSREGRDESTRVYYRNPTLRKRSRMLGLQLFFMALITIGAMAWALVKYTPGQAETKAREAAEETVEKDAHRKPGGVGPGT